MDGFIVYKLYMSVKLHFTTNKFDIFSTRGRLKGTRSQYESRNDYKLFEHIGEKYTDKRKVVEFFVANFAYGNDLTLYSPAESEDFYKEWVKRKESLSYVFTEDLKLILDYTEKHNATDIYSSIQGNYPILLNLFLGNKIKIETMSMLDDCYGYLLSWESQTFSKLLFETEIRRIKKLKGFILYNKTSITKIYNAFQSEFDSVNA